MSEAYFQAMYRIIVAGHWVTDQVSTSLKEFGATEPQFNVLRILAGAKGKPLAVQEISEKMVQRSSNVTRIIDKLVGSGYVERKECEKNRRKMDILLTDEGSAYLRKLNKKVNEFHRKYRENLTENENEKLITLINKLFNNEYFKND